VSPRSAEAMDTKKDRQKVFAYLRVSTDRQDLANQKLEILSYANKNGMKIDEFIEIEISSRKDLLKRRINELLEKVGNGDTVIVAELSRIGRSIVEVINIVNKLVKKKVRLIAIKQGLDIRDNQDMQTKIMITMFSLFAEIERDLISQRTKAALAMVKSTGKKLGKPKGSIGKSKLDPYKEFIEGERVHKASKSLIARKLKTMIGNCTRQNLDKFMKNRGIK
jgi:putative DNA-invertase from lambdoid prophage Rac